MKAKTKLKRRLLSLKPKKKSMSNFNSVSMILNKALQLGLLDVVNQARKRIIESEIRKELNKEVIKDEI